MRRVRRVLIQLPQARQERFLSLCASVPEAMIADVLRPEVLRETASRRCAEDCLQHMRRRGLKETDCFLDRDLSIYLPNHNLLYTDKMGMAVGVEARVPLLDIELVNLATRLPARWKIAGAHSKAILRDAARTIVPDNIIRRPKAGFGAPYRKWLRSDLKELWEDLTSEQCVGRRGWFRHDALKRVRQLSQSGRSDLYMLQWAVLSIELWARQFIDANPAVVGAGDSDALRRGAQKSPRPPDRIMQTV